MYRLHESPPGEALSLLLYGGSGVGKTWFCGTTGSKTLYINTGEGIETLRSKAFKAKYPDCNPLVVDIREKVDERGLVSSAVGFDAVCDTIDEAMLKHRKDFDTIVIDDMSSVSSFALNKALELNASSGKSKTLTVAKAGKHFPLVAVQDRGIEMDAIKFFFGTYVPLCKREGVHFICLAHERSVYTQSRLNDEPRLRRVFPLFTGKDSFAPDIVPAFFDEVWQMYVAGAGDQLKRRFRTQRNEVVVAKTRHAGIFKEVEENLDWSKVLERVRP